MPEQQNIEYKASWRDEYLKWICGFANAQGGRIFIGIDDNGEVTGEIDDKKLMDEIPNKVVSHLGIVVDVNLHSKKGKSYIEIIVPVSSAPISYHGAFHYRSGSTKQELKGNALHKFLLDKIGISWEQQVVSAATIADIDEDVVKRFLKKAVTNKRISSHAAGSDTLSLLKQLKLVNEKGEFLLAALLLFGKNPQKYAPSAYFKIGRFGRSQSDLRFQDIVEGNILDMADSVLEILEKKYLTRPISYERLLRKEPLEYPEKALREAILNSVIHKKYEGTTIFLSVYEDRLTIWNPGKLPDDLSVEKLQIKHRSIPRNRLIADVFFMAGYIEAWGRGFEVMQEGCREYGLPDPVVVEEQGGIEVAFLKDLYTEEHLQNLDLSNRQAQAVLYVKKHGRITNAEYCEITGVSDRTALRDLNELMERHIFSKNGTTGKNISYALIY